MALIPRDVVDAVRDRTDIVEVVRRQVRLDRKGQSWVGLCPFHKEKTPSFNVIPSKQIYYCFGCQAAGDVFRFLMLTQNVSFVEAVTQLATPAGVVLEQRDLSPEERERYRRRRGLYDVMEAAAGWFESQLWTSAEGAEARAYLQRRAMSDELARKARLGWAPEGWTRLVDHLQREGVRPDMLVKAGLARERDGRIYDAFRERLIIPIRDERGRTIAFGGRILRGDGPKYINSPETDLYDKGKVLYGLDMAHNVIRSRGRAVLVEGYFDVLSLHQAGFDEAVATCGTALTPDHADRLAALTRQVLVLTDADEAGARAAERAYGLLRARGLSALRLQLPDAKDPDELIRERGAEAMGEAMKAAVPLLEWLVRRRLRAEGYDAAAKQRVLDEILAAIPDPTDVEVFELANLINLPERAVRDATRRRPAAAVDEPGHEGVPTWKPSRDITHLVWLLVHRHGAVADLIRYVDPSLFQLPDAAAQLVARLVLGEDPRRLLDDVADEGCRRLLGAVVARDRLYGEDEAAQGLVQILLRLAKPLSEGRLAALQDAAGRAAREGRSAEASTATRALLQERTWWRHLEDAARRGELVEVATALGPREGSA